MSNLVNDTFCLAPWVHSYCGTQKERTLCCASLDDMGNGLSFEDYWNGEKMKNIRKKMLNGEYVSACDNCYNVPALHSYKHHFNGMYSHTLDGVLSNTDENGIYKGLPITMDYRNSLCNLRCRMCGSNASTSIRADFNKIDKYTNNDELLSSADIKQLEIDQLNEMIFFIENSNIEEIYWAGGEPLFNINHYKVLERLIELGKTDVLIRYNTNLTNLKFKNYDFIELISKFTNVHFYFSQDGIGDVAEYIRYGVKFDEWESNLDKILLIKKENWQFHFHSVVTILTLLDIENILKFVESKKILLVNFFKCYVDEYKNLLGLEFYPKEIIESIIDDKINLINSQFDKNLNVDITLGFLCKVKDELANPQHLNMKWENTMEALHRTFTYINDLDILRPFNMNFYEMIKVRNQKLYDFVKNMNNRLYECEDLIDSKLKGGVLNSRMYKLYDTI